MNLLSVKAKISFSDISENNRTITDRGEDDMKKIYGYARVSSREQNLDRQLKALADFGVEERDIVTDKESGKSREREGYQMLKNHLLREGDTLVIMSLDRLCRNKSHIKTELEYCKEHHIRVKILDIPTTLIELPEEQDWIFDMINNILIEVLASIAEQERVRTLQRQAQGIAAAKEKGKHLGRPKADYPENWDDVYGRWKRGEITAKNARSIQNLKRSTFYKLAALLNNNILNIQ